MKAAVTQKGVYAVRAVFALARHGRQRGPLRMADIASEQNIPPRYLEAILNQLRRAGIIQSQRGPDGGYVLVQAASSLTVAMVIQAVQGHAQLVRRRSRQRPVVGDVIAQLLQRSAEAAASVLDNTSLAQLVDEDATMQRNKALMFDI
jgi:Rrf2 family protein